VDRSTEGVKKRVLEGLGRVIEEERRRTGGGKEGVGGKREFCPAWKLSCRCLLGYSGIRLWCFWIVYCCGNSISCFVGLLLIDLRFVCLPML
jgi:hypothetical protein